LKKDTSDTLYINLYFSEDGLNSGIIQELPLVHQINGIQANYPNIVYGIQGAYFVITDNQQLLSDIEKEMKKKSFYSRISPDKGEININLSTAKLRLPTDVKKAVDIYTEHISGE